MTSAATGRRLVALDQVEVSSLHSVKPRKVGGLAQMGISSVLDLMMHYPRRWVDRRNQVAIAELVEDEEAMVTGRVCKVTSRRLRGGARTMVTVVVEDGSGRLTIVFFNQAWRVHQLAVGTEVAVFGAVQRYRDAFQMTNPLVDLVGDRTGRIVPIYPQSGKAKISSIELSGYVTECLDRAGTLADVVPQRWLDELGLVGRTEAFRQIHAPEDFAMRDRARRRLAFDELIRLQLVLVKRRRDATTNALGIAHRAAWPRGSDGPSDLVGEFIGGLPFELTAAQARAIEEIAADLAAAHPMHRLLQGDVGSGKTVVALAALLYAIAGGHQGALMVPTEVLAEQHFLSAREMLAGLEVADSSRLGGRRPLEVVLLTSRTPASERQRIQTQLLGGGIDLVVGTHALLTDDVVFAALGAAVVDEQHRFGVEQRAALRDKGPPLPGASPTGTAVDPAATHLTPDLLVMTATPIPRTAAMTVYGDLDLSVLGELPKGRAKVTTRWIEDEDEQAAWKAVRGQLDQGRQAYVICPLVRGGEPELGDDDPDAGDDDPDAGDELDAGDPDAGQVRDAGGDPDGDPGAEHGPSRSPGRQAVLDLDLGLETEPEKAPPRSVTDEAVRLAEGELEGYRLQILHGQLPAREKEAAMAAFRSGELQVLVATTVVEVGVDVPNATVMVIEDADRFGIAQLHQLRGRVGRSSHRSWCFLLARGVTPAAERRLEALQKSTDGFELAEVDLDLRGEGTVLGTRQKGRSDLKLASLRRDGPLVREARRVAEQLVEEDPELEHHQLLRDEVRLFVPDEDGAFLQKS